MADLKESQGSIVVVGALNPLIFQPEWLRQNQIIGKSEAESAKDGKSIDIMHDQVTQLSLTNMRLVVEPNRFVVTALQEPLVLARDFTANCFRLLAHTPTSAMGFNFSIVFKLAKESSWHAFGDMLAPKQPWSSFLDRKPGETGVVGGLRSVTMERSQRRDGALGYERVTIEPLEGRGAETKISYNDHFQFDPHDPTPGSKLVEILETEWEASERRARTIFDSLIEQANGL